MLDECAELYGVLKYCAKPFSDFDSKTFAKRCDYTPYHIKESGMSCIDHQIFLHETATHICNGSSFPFAWLARSEVSGHIDQSPHIDCQLALQVSSLDYELCAT